jgi:hypothetical protein
MPQFREAVLPHGHEQQSDSLKIETTTIKLKY